LHTAPDLLMLNYLKYKEIVNTQLA
jgi:hypothetical protein